MKCRARTAKCAWPSAAAPRTSQRGHSIDLQAGMRRTPTPASDAAVQPRCEARRRIVLPGTESLSAQPESDYPSVSPSADITSDDVSPADEERCRISAQDVAGIGSVRPAAHHRHVSGRGHPRRHRSVRRVLGPHDRRRQGGAGYNHRRNQGPAMGCRAPRDPPGPGPCRS